VILVDGRFSFVVPEQAVYASPSHPAKCRLLKK
jgi:hypothetical protein